VLTVRNVRGTISPGLGEECLLGMSFLSNFSIVQEGDTLVIANRGGAKP
jgi:predicted aspartyl protease